MTRQTAKRSLLTAAVMAVFLWAATPAFSLDLVSEYSIPLKSDDRILGSLEGNYLVYGRPEITMYNARGRAVFSKKLKNNVKPTLSPGGNVLGLITYADHSPTDLKTSKLEIFDQAGRLQWQMADPAANAFFITDKGAIFGIEGVEGLPPTRLHLYDQYGNLINILTFKDYNGLAISPAGGKFIIDRAKAGLDVYDSTGEFLASLPASEMYAFDRDQRYIGVFFEGVFRLFQDEKEVVLIKTQEKTLRGLAINVEQNLLAMAGPNKLEVYELTTKKLLWAYPLAEAGHQFTSLDISKDGQFIACGMDINAGSLVAKESRHVEGHLLLFPRSGQTMTRKRETYQVWGVGLPRGVFSESGGSLMLQTREKLEKLKIR